jgi:hypothetical protein
VKNLGIPPSRVVIEIVESSLDDIVPLEKFVRRYKEYGFLIAIDDLGAGFSNLSRTINIQPNIIELDMNLVRGVSKDFHKRETTKAVIQLAHTTGALTVGEGVENMEDAVCLLNSGVDMLQGYLFAKPSSPQHFNRNATDLTIKKLIEKFKTERIEDYKNKKKEVKIYNGISNSFIEKLSHYGGDKFDGILNVLINKFKEIECAYIIDKNGIQISDTISKADSTNNTLFRPDSKGVDQSSKDYFFYIRAGQNFFVSDPYISVATGNICTTISSRFSDLRGNNYVLCIDMINRRQ